MKLVPEGPGITQQRGDHGDVGTDMRWGCEDGRAWEREWETRILEMELRARSFDAICYQQDSCSVFRILQELRSLLTKNPKSIKNSVGTSKHCEFSEVVVCFISWRRQPGPGKLQPLVWNKANTGSLAVNNIQSANQHTPGSDVMPQRAGPFWRFFN